MLATCKAIRGHIKADPTPDWNSIKRGALCARVLLV
jgi:hypothetical protein